MTERSAGTGTRTTSTGQQHPLDPLSADEFRQAAAVLRRDRGVDQRWRFASIELREPSKQTVREFVPGALIDREARVVCFNREDGQAYKALVSLTGDRVITWEHQPGIQPNITVDEWRDVDASLRANPQMIEALARRGITDLSLALLDPWAYRGALVPEKYQGRRVAWGDVWYRNSEHGNPYANPVSGLHFVVDLNSMELLEIEDSFEVEPADVMGEYIPTLVPGMEVRADLKPLEIVQPEGVSFTLDGFELRWQRWSMRLGFNYREGPVIHRLGYEDGGRVRPIAHRLSFAEMVVPYRDSTVDHYRRTAYDTGEWGLGFMTTSLELGCDCLGEIVYVDATLHDSAGEPYTIPNAICIHEEDNAVLWKHVDASVQIAEVRRARRLVVSAHLTVANYEYLVYWRFYQDGSIECEVRASGIMVTTHFAEGAQPPYGTLVDQRTYAPYHQHFIVARLDMEVDGEDNTVLMSESEALPIGPDNPHGLAMVQHNTPLRTEADGKQDYSWATQRYWKVENPNRRNALGNPVAYKLVPTAAIPPLMDPNSPVYQVAQVIGHTLWVTPFDSEQRWPCGEFVNQSREDLGLPRWTAANRPIENTDVVVWYVFGIHHITRVEDWPVMPVDTVSFWLKPFGFFDRNPALDVAPSPPAACHQEHHATGGIG